MLRCKCIIAVFLSVSAVSAFDTTWHAPLKAVIVHTHRLGVYDATPDVDNQTGDVHYDDDVEA